MAKRTSPTPKFMKYSGSIQGPADLSSRHGFSLVVERKSEVEPSPKSDGRKTGKPRFYGSGVDDSHPFTNSTRLRRAIPDGPLAIHGLASSVQAVPAMSR